MDIREKLIDLLADANNPVWKWFPNNASMMQLANYLIAHGITVQEWISVDDRLPQEDGAYLATINFFNKGKYIDIRSFAKDGEIVDEYELAGQENVWYYYDSERGYISTDSITHWMPLPELPKEV